MATQRMAHAYPETRSLAKWRRQFGEMRVTAQGKTTASARPRSGATARVCANCAARLQGRWCHGCGQDSHGHKRAIGHLAWEAIEGLFHLDGRLATTLPALFVRPGKLARDYMEGRIARHVPPFRLFLVSLLVFILAAEWAAHRNTVDNEQRAHARAVALATPQGRAAEAVRLRVAAAQARIESLQEAASDRADELQDADTRAGAEAHYARNLARADVRYGQALAKADRVAQGLPEPPPKPAAAEAAVGAKAWWKGAVKKAEQNPEYYWSILFAWGHRAAVLLLPIVGLTLALVYRGRRELFLYDHLLVAMDLMAFGFLANAPGFLLPMPWAGWWLGAVALWTPINLFQTLRGGYGSGVLGATVKTLVVWTVSVSAFGVLLLGLMVLALAQLA
ncbi:MAG: Membrane protein involved in colicin uptake [Phenylobacterium sp.]|nr:Membrane protein involved in colicin uptake [Phenylobacterium sp.]